MEDVARTVSVQNAIRRGVLMVERPSHFILSTTTVACLVLLVKQPSFWDLAVIPIGMVISYLYESEALPRWRIWAYENVADIDQLQRSAELSGLLKLDSYNNTRGLFIGRRRSTALEEQIKRFSQDAVFVDDVAIPEETAISSTSIWDEGKGPLITLSERGIAAYGVGFFEWGKVENERLAVVGFSYDSPHNGKDDRTNPAGGAYFFKFDSEGEVYDTPMKTLKIAIWKMDLLIYIYRGRYAVCESAQKEKQDA